MVSRLGRSGLGWFCFGVSCFGVSLDQDRAGVTRRPFLAGLLFWFQRNLHAGAGPAPAPPGSSPIRPEGILTTLGKPKTRALSRQRLSIEPRTVVAPLPAQSRSLRPCPDGSLPVFCWRCGGAVSPACLSCFTPRRCSSGGAARSSARRRTRYPVHATAGARHPFRRPRRLYRYVRDPRRRKSRPCARAAGIGAATRRCWRTPGRYGDRPLRRRAIQHASHVRWVGGHSAIAAESSRRLLT